MTGGGTSTNTVQQTIPSWLQPYYTQGLNYGQNLLQSGGPQYYPGQTVAPLNPVQEAGASSLVNAAGMPSASQGAQYANQFETSGALLNPSMNPYLQGTFNQAANQVQNQISSEFAGAGRNVTGSLPVQTDAMNNLATQLYGGAYNTGLQNMTQATALAPSIDQGTYLPSQELLSAGSGLQNQTQNLINASQQAWNYQQQLPYNTLSWYSGLLGQNGAPFGGSSSTGQMNNSPFSSLVGGGLLGASALSSLGLLGGGAAAAAPSWAATALGAGLTLA